MSVRRFDIGWTGDMTYELDDPRGEYVLHSDYTALLARHNALREAVHMAMDRTAGCDKKQTDDQLIADVAYLKRLASDYFKTSVDCGNKAFAAEQKYDALVEAVAKMFAAHEAWTQKGGASYPDWADGRARYDAARAEVDRLLEEQ